LAVLNFSQINFSCLKYCLMPSGWDMAGVKKVGKIIGEDAKGEYNIASIIDGDTRAYPYRYMVSLEKVEPPLGVDEYPRVKTLYVISRETETGVLSYPVWEIYSILPAKVTKIWPIKNGISLFKLEKI